MYIHPHNILHERLLREWYCFRINDTFVHYTVSTSVYNPITPLSPKGAELQRSLFEKHKVASAHLIRVLMRIFVDIEYTGDSMEFEAKFRESRSVCVHACV